jgi:hypothetical protein
MMPDSARTSCELADTLQDKMRHEGIAMRGARLPQAGYVSKITLIEHRETFR